MKNIVTLAFALFVIMVLSTVIVIGFNFAVGLNTDVNNDDVATSIAAVAFLIALVLKLIYGKRLD